MDPRFGFYKKIMQDPYAYEVVWAPIYLEPKLKRLSRARALDSGRFSGSTGFETSGYLLTKNTSLLGR